MPPEPIVPLKGAWPAMSLSEAEALLTAPGQRFEMETVEIGGVSTRVWKHAPANLALLIEASRQFGDQLFTIHEDERVSYAANYRAVAHLAAALRTMGVGKGDRVALAMRNLPEWPVIFFATVSIGAIAVPLNAWWTGGELDHALRDSGARVLFADSERFERIAAILPELPDLEHVVISRCDDPPNGLTRLEALIGSPRAWDMLPDLALAADPTLTSDDDATIFYTSGTSGHPKGALGTHRNLATNILSSGYAAARTFLRRGQMPPEPTPKVGLLVIPLFHVTACSASLMGVVATGSTLVFLRKWDPLAALAAIERERVQQTGGVPTIAWQLLEHPARGDYDLTSLEMISYGGAPAASELARRIHAEFGALPGNGWGMTETMATVTLHSGEDYLARPTSAGPPVPVARLKIMDLEGTRELPIGQVGELWASGPMIVKGYWNQPEASAQCFRDGWVRTGDLARLDEEGFLFIVDRAKDMIIRGGENIYSAEVEDALFAHPAVTDAALIGLPHRTLGEVPAAVVHLAPGMSASEAELQAWVRDRLAAFKVPVALRFLDQPLPRNANGKILKTALRALFSSPAP